MVKCAIKKFIFEVRPSAVEFFWRWSGMHLLLRSSGGENGSYAVVMPLVPVVACCMFAFGPSVICLSVCPCYRLLVLAA